jgi:stage V sporulation protein D (sporulation-specific penicillin-binding protein)
LVREISKDKRTLKEFKKEVVRSVLSRSTTGQLRQILRSVVANGSGSKADIPGYAIAGKTGTGQVAEAGGYSSTKVNASFLGFGPSDKPRLIGLVVMREPQTAITYGGTLAAPPLARIFADAFAYLGLPPKEEEKPASDQWATVPNVRNYPPGEAQQKLLAEGLTFQMEGDGKMVTEQSPKPGVRVKKGSKIILHFHREELYNRNGGLVTVPSLEKMTVRDAANTLSILGLRLEIQGSGIAARQAPAAGKKVKPGTRIRVFFEFPGREERKSEN